MRGGTDAGRGRRAGVEHRHGHPHEVTTTSQGGHSHGAIPISEDKRGGRGGGGRTGSGGGRDKNRGRRWVRPRRSSMSKCAGGACGRPPPGVGAMWRPACVNAQRERAAVHHQVWERCGAGCIHPRFAGERPHPRSGVGRRGLPRAGPGGGGRRGLPRGACHGRAVAIPTPPLRIVQVAIHADKCTEKLSNPTP